MLPSAAADLQAEETPRSPKPLSEPSEASGPGDIATGILSVDLLKKRFSKQDYQEFMWFDIEFTAKGLDKPARAIKGVLNLRDLFGESKMGVNWTLDEPIAPAEVWTERGTGFKFNEFIISHQWFRATDLQNMTASFTVQSILYEDGSRRDF